MRDNLNFYKNLPEVDTDKIIDIEEEDYVKMYFKGTDLYDEKNWKFMVDQTCDNEHSKSS